MFRSFNVHGLSVLSAITAQNTQGVDAVFPVDKDTFEKQLRILLSDIRPDAFKIGMLFSGWSADILAEIFTDNAFRNIVIDPVTISSSGMSLVDEGTLDLIRSKLFPLSRIITPNIYEASVLTGIMIEEQTGMEEAAQSLKSMGPEVIVITGGHLEEKAVDLYFDGAFHYIKGEKMKGDYHGTTSCRRRCGSCTCGRSDTSCWSVWRSTSARRGRGRCASRRATSRGAVGAGRGRGPTAGSTATGWRVAGPIAARGRSVPGAPRRPMWFERAVGLAPDVSTWLTGMAVALANTGRLDKALALQLVALRQDPVSRRAAENALEFASALGDSAEAERLRRHLGRLGAAE